MALDTVYLPTRLVSIRIRGRCRGKQRRSVIAMLALLCFLNNFNRNKHSLCSRVNLVILKLSMYDICMYKYTYVKYNINASNTSRFSRTPCDSLFFPLFIRRTFTVAAPKLFPSLSFSRCIIVGTFACAYAVHTHAHIAHTHAHARHTQIHTQRHTYTHARAFTQSPIHEHASWYLFHLLVNRLKFRLASSNESLRRRIVILKDDATWSRDYIYRGKLKK